jgi:hypothetical protein
LDVRRRWRRSSQAVTAATLEAGFSSPGDLADTRVEEALLRVSGPRTQAVQPALIQPRCFGAYVERMPFLVPGGEPEPD